MVLVDGPRLRCPLCLSPGTCQLRWDKRGRPFIRCAWCLSTAFLPTQDALISLLALCPQLDSVLEGRASVDDLRREARKEEASARAAEVR